MFSIICLRSSLYRFVKLTAIVCLPFALMACQTTKDEDVTGSIGQGAQSAQHSFSESHWRAVVEKLRPQYDAAPGENAEVSIRYARALRGIGQRQQAVAVLQQTSLRHSDNQAVLGAYGRALADVGSFDRALEVLSNAHDADRPDWSILSAQGAVLDQLGRHQEARAHYESSLRLNPNNPNTLSNLGLSYLLSKDLENAEKTLKLAMAQPNAPEQARQNLGLVVGLQGRFKEAEQIVSADLPAQKAEENVRFLRQMLTQQNRWQKISSGDSMQNTG